MTGDASAVLTRRRGLLERAIRYARTVVVQVRPTDLARPTPCAGWDLLDLMRHLNESVAALREAVEHACVFPGPAPGGAGRDVLETFDMQSGLLLSGWDEQRGDRPVTVGRRPVPGLVVANAGAVELAVHGWDVAQACGLPDGIPLDLAAHLLAVARWVVPWPRFPQFGPEVPAGGAQAADERLLAFLGRRASLGPAPNARGGPGRLTGAPTGFPN